MQTMSGPVVNGGLIDFQDNFHRGMGEYACFQQGQQLPGMMAGMGSYAMPQAGFQNMAQFQGHPSLAATPMPGAAGPGQVQCISGPPAFLHMHGQTYVPAETQTPVGVSATKSAAPVEAAPEPAPRVLSEEEIERRVRERVDAWASSQRRPVYTASAPSESRKNLKGRAMTDEERAVERIKSVNAGMRGRSGFCSPF